MSGQPISHRSLIRDLNDAIYHHNKNTDLTKVFPELKDKWVASSKLDGRIGDMIYRKYPGLFRDIFFPAYKEMGKDIFLRFLTDLLDEEMNIYPIANKVLVEMKAQKKMQKNGKLEIKSWFLY